jgi:hypothetical protein
MRTRPRVVVDLAATFVASDESHVWECNGRGEKLKTVLTLTLTFYPLPQGEEIAVGRFWFCE